MRRIVLAVFLLAVLCVPQAMAGVACDDLGIGVRLGAMLPNGGDQEEEEAGFLLGLQVKKPLTDNVWMAIDYSRGTSGHAEIEEVVPGRFQSWSEEDGYMTVWNRAELAAVYNFSPDERYNPFVSVGAGFTFWEVQDWRDGISDEGEVPEGYNTDGNATDLSGTNFFLSVGAGVEIFAAERTSITLGGKYAYLLQSDTDNVGLSALNGPDYVDANPSLLEGYVGINYYFGPGDCDGDGIIGRQDKCSRKPEDFDGFEDEDGCPDVDNDGDGILDVDDACPDDAEDFDGEDDEDGCPDVDMDGDGILDMDDACPEEPEDIDGYKDADGCPDPDNDMDGVLDAADKCPGTPRGTEVDDDGCPKREEAVMVFEPVIVNFLFNNAMLTADGTERLDGLIAHLERDPDVIVEIGGHACDLGDEAYNIKLSRRRAESVYAYLVEHGVDEARLNVEAYGETKPMIPNDDEAAREQNRRVVVKRMSQ